MHVFQREPVGFGRVRLCHLQIKEEGPRGQPPYLLFWWRGEGLGQGAVEVRDSDEGGVSLGVLLEVSGSWRR